MVMQVGVKDSGALCTARPLSGHFYEFLLQPSGDLAVTEIRQRKDGGGQPSAAAEDRLELLDGTAAQA